MSKPDALDDDLYGDIYDELSDSIDDGAVSSSDHDSSSAGTKAAPIDPLHAQSADARQQGPSLDSPAVSYSAQIAQQFSAYKQTPSQERQAKVNVHPLPPVPSFQIHGSIFGKKPSEMHDSGKLFVGGLSWDTTDEGLRDYFEQFGKVDACTIMRDPATGTSRGFAFLTFEDANNIDAVFKHEHTLDGKQIDPKRAIPREEHLRNARYFVGGLSHSTTVETMRTFFAQFGKVVDATVMLDRDTGRSKGFGFVTFDDNAAGLDQTVVGKGLLTLDDKEIEVKLAQPRNQRDQARNLVNKITSNRDSTTPDRSLSQPQQPIKMLSSSTSSSSPLSIQQQTPNPMGMMFPGRSITHHLPGMMSANGMPSMMGMNPMIMGMASGMGGMGGMPGMGVGGMNGMNGMGGMGGMNMAGLNNGNMGPAAMHPNMHAMMGHMNMMQNMQNMGVMRMGMMGGGGGGGGGMPGMMGMPGMSPMAAAMMGGGGMGMGVGNMAKNAMNSGLGPIRMSGGVNRKQQQHGFHPYSR